MSLRYRLQAYRELYRRYREVFSYFWKARKSLRPDFFNEQEAEFLPAALSIQEKPVSTTARFTGRVLIALLVTLLLWAILGKVDIIVTARGKIIPSEYTKTIASVEVAAVRALHVREGQTVKAGEVLVELDSSSPDAEHTKAAKSQQEALLQQARAQALINAIDQLKPPQLRHPELTQVSVTQWQQAQQQLTSQYEDFYSKLMRINAEIGRYKAMLPLAEQQARDYRILAQNHDVANHAWLEKEQAYLQLKGQLADAKNQRSTLITQTRKESWDMLTEGRKAELAYEQDAKRNRAHSLLLKLHAPVDGTVQQLNIHTIGGVVPAAQPLMLIVPKNQNIEVEAFIENKDIGFVREGQSAAIKVDAFEYTKYGTVPARVIHVSRDAIQDEKLGLIYSVKVSLDQSSLMVDGKAVALSPGMSVAAEIKTGERRIINYILSPLMKHTREALRER